MIYWETFWCSHREKCQWQRHFLWYSFLVTESRPRNLGFDNHLRERTGCGFHNALDEFRFVLSINLKSFPNNSYNSIFYFSMQLLFCRHQHFVSETDANTSEFIQLLISAIAGGLALHGHCLSCNIGPSIRTSTVKDKTHTHKFSLKST